jgi:hypothetical protein
MVPAQQPEADPIHSSKTSLSISKQYPSQTMAPITKSDHSSGQDPIEPVIPKSTRMERVMNHVPLIMMCFQILGMTLAFGFPAIYYYSKG